MDDRLREWSDLLDPRQTAVLVVDVQKWFTQPRPAPMFPQLEEVLPRLQRFLDRATGTGVLIIRVQLILPEETYSEVWRRQFRVGWGSKSPLGPEEEGPGSTQDSSRDRAISSSPRIATAHSLARHSTPSCARVTSAR